MSMKLIFLTLSSIKSMMKSGKILFSPSGFLIAFHTSYIFVFVILKLDQTTFAKQLFIFAIHSTISRTLGLIQLVSSVANATDWNFFIITILLILQQGLFVVKKCAKCVLWNGFVNSQKFACAHC